MSVEPGYIVEVSALIMRLLCLFTPMIIVTGGIVGFLLYILISQTDVELRDIMEMIAVCVALFVILVPGCIVAGLMNNICGVLLGAVISMLIWIVLESIFS